jgi:hypothetical protein
LASSEKSEDDFADENDEIEYKLSSRPETKLGSKKK